MSRFLEPLKRKYGPLPGWAWLAIFTAGLLVWRWWKSRSAPTTTEPADTSGAESYYGSPGYDMGYGGSSGGGDYSSGGGGTSGSSGGTTPIEEVPTTDETGATPTPATAKGFWWGQDFITSAAMMKAWGAQHGWKPGQFQIWASHHQAAARLIGVTPPPPAPAGARLVTAAKQPRYSFQARAANTRAARARARARSAMRHKPAKGRTPKPVNTAKARKTAARAVRG